MKDDYLWDKSGEVDKEIERLENALQIYRYKPDAAPLFPTPIIATKKDFWQMVRRLTILASPAAAGLIVLGLFFGWSRQNGNTQLITENVAQTIEIETPQTAVSAQSEIVVEQQEEFQKKIAPTESVSNYGLAFRRVRSRTAGGKVFKPKLITRKRQDLKKELKLTEEELYAYEQLMKALRITNSKFVLIQRKIQGEKEEKQNARS